MIFQDAIGALLEGKFVTREIWNDEGGYLVCLPGLTHPLKTVIQPKPECRPWAPDMSDCTATDWNIVDKASETDKVE